MLTVISAAESSPSVVGKRLGKMGSAKLVCLCCLPEDNSFTLKHEPGCWPPRPSWPGWRGGPGSGWYWPVIVFSELKPHGVIKWILLWMVGGELAPPTEVIHEACCWEMHNSPNRKCNCWGLLRSLGQCGNSCLGSGYTNDLREGLQHSMKYSRKYYVCVYVFLCTGCECKSWYVPVSYCKSKQFPKLWTVMPHRVFCLEMAYVTAGASWVSHVMVPVIVSYSSMTCDQH
jgi:hypothetical protein